MLFITVKQNTLFTSGQLNTCEFHIWQRAVNNVKFSGISDYLLTCDCNINFRDFKILSKDSNNFNLLIKEKLFMTPDNPIVNKTVTSFSLELVR